MKQLQICLIMITAALLFTACQKNESTNLLAISGEVLIEDALIPEIKTPLEGITVYLLNSPFSVDTISWWVTQTDILDSTQTDHTGLYKFKNLQTGNYVVLPFDRVINYQFDWSASPDSNTISVENTQTDYTINFTAPEVIADNAPGTFTFEFNNIRNGSVNYWISISRKERHRLLWWGDWNWDKSSNSTYWYSAEEKNVYTTNHTDTYFKEYKDEFYIFFSMFTPMNGKYIPRGLGSIELKAADLKAVNKFNLDWYGDGVIITQVE